MSKSIHLAAGHHTAQDEFACVVEGEVALVTASGEDVLCATRRAGARAIAPELEGDPTGPSYTERRDWLAKALVELPTEQRVTLELTEYGGYSCEEIASIMFCPVNTVKARMYYAREKLRALLPALASPIGTCR